MEPVTKIGERIRKLREEKGLTQQALAKELGVKRESINMWENGLRDLKTGALLLLSEYFGVSCDYILTGISAKNRDISNSLGLSNNAIDNLVFMNEQLPEVVDVVSDFLCDVDRMMDVASCIESFQTKEAWRQYLESKSVDELMQEFKQDDSVGIARVRLLGYQNMEQTKLRIYEIVMQWVEKMAYRTKSRKSEVQVDKQRLGLQIDIESYIARKTKEVNNAKAQST